MGASTVSGGVLGIMVMMLIQNRKNCFTIVARQTLTEGIGWRLGLVVASRID